MLLFIKSNVESNILKIDTTFKLEHLKCFRVNTNPNKFQRSTISSIFMRLHIKLNIIQIVWHV